MHPYKNLRHKAAAATSKLLLLFAAVASAGCSGLTTVKQPQQVQLTCSPATSHQPHIWFQYSPDITGSMPQNLVQPANHLVADWIDTLPQVDSEGATIFETTIQHDSYAPEATRLSFTIPAVAAYPVCPTPGADTRACSTPNANGYACGGVQATAEATYTTAVDQYAATVHQLDAQVAAAQTAVRTQTDALRQQHLPTDNISTSIWGAVDLAAQRFAGRSGPKDVVLVTDGQNNTDIDHIPLRLDGITVWFVSMFCANAVNCQAVKDYWRAALTKAGAAGVAFVDPGASNALPPPWRS